MAGGDLNYLLSLANSCFRSQMFGNVQPTVAYPFENVLITSCFWTGRLSSILDIKCAVHSIQSLVCTAFHLREWMCVGLSCFESQTSLFASRGCWKPALPIWNICTVTTLYWDDSINLSLIGCVLILPRHSLDQLFFNLQPAVSSQNARWTSQLCGLETFKALDSFRPTVTGQMHKQGFVQERLFQMIFGGHQRANSTGVSQKNKTYVRAYGKNIPSSCVVSGTTEGDHSKPSWLMRNLNGAPLSYCHQNCSTSDKR